MTPRALWCAYPWDLVDAPESASRARDTGADGVALAAAYHAVRAATPLHPRHRTVNARHSAIYVPYRAATWRGRRIRPRAAGAWVPERAYENAAASARAVGLEVEPWVVLTHDDDGTMDDGSMDDGHADDGLRVLNAFGDSYGYALCPSNEDVREYCATLTGESVLLSGAESVMIEACGPLGVEHLGPHEKTAGADWTPLDVMLLSICFCNECRRGLITAGHDPEVIRSRTKRGIGSGAASMDDVLGDATASVLDVRRDARDRLAQEVSDAARSSGAKAVRFHAQRDPWATGPFAALWETPTPADSVIVPADHLPSPAQRWARDDGRRLGAYLSVMPPADPDDFVELWQPRLRDIDDLYLYHLGLLSSRRIAAGAALIDTLRDAAEPLR